MQASAIGINSNGSKDYGLMQINSLHLNWLKNQGIDEAMLVNDPCVSILVGAYILKGMFEKYGYSWEAVGAYNAGLSKDNYNLRMSYAKKVWQRYRTGPAPLANVTVTERHRKLKILRSDKRADRGKIIN